MLAEVVAGALAAANGSLADVGWAGYGIAGADRPKDFTAIEQQLPVSLPAERCRLVNDTQLALRAGTADGVGVAVVSGTGSNALGCARDGQVIQLGGFGHELGDFGSATDLGREALRLAMRGRDGRGAPTALYQALCIALEVSPLEDVMDSWISGQGSPDDLGRLAPVVFETAAQGDAVALDLLERTGRELVLCAELLLKRLFRNDPAAVVVLGGSVLQRGRKTDATIVTTIVAELRKRWPKAEVRCLEAEPVVGAVLLAHDLARPETPRADFEAGLRASVGGAFSSPVVA
jgi:N-acetylglucosamine kinase-like BadF-type ATPase